MRHYYSESEIEFLRENSEKYTCVEITKVFNEIFGTSLSIGAIRIKMSNLGLKYILENGIHKYTNEEKKWLRNNFDKHSYKELAILFNEKFECNITEDKLKDVCVKQLKLSKSNNSGQFCKKQRCINLLPIGTEKIDNRGYTWIKISDIPYDEDKTQNENKLVNWILKQNYVYEQAYGNIPDNYFVIFLDGNKENFELSNLYCVNRTIHAVMCKNRWYTCNKDNTLVALKWCELFYALKE